MYAALRAILNTSDTMTTDNNKEYLKWIVGDAITAYVKAIAIDQ